MENGYQYESTYAEMMQQVKQEVLQVSIGKVPKGVNSKKKTPDTIWKNRIGQETYFINLSHYNED